MRPFRLAFPASSRLILPAQGIPPVPLNRRTGRKFRSVTRKAMVPPRSSANRTLQTERIEDESLRFHTKNDGKQRKQHAVILTAGIEPQRPNGDEAAGTGSGSIGALGFLIPWGGNQKKICNPNGFFHHAQWTLRSGSETDHNRLRLSFCKSRDGLRLRTIWMRFFPRSTTVRGETARNFTRPQNMSISTNTRSFVHKSICRKSFANNMLQHLPRESVFWKFQA